LVSFLMRVFNIIARTIGLLIWLSLVISLFFAWILLPIVVLYFLVDAIWALMQPKE